MSKRICIMGIRGVPARHGGFETFAEQLALYLVEHDWEVTVYCQEEGVSGPIREDTWRNVNRVIIPVKQHGARGTVIFDWLAIQHALNAQHKLALTLGYNTAAFCLRYRLHGIRNLINMDGIEWRRAKWRLHERAWLWLNERCGCWFGDHLIADHPEIKQHLSTRVRPDKITMIPYGATEVTAAAASGLQALGLEPGHFVTVIARPEPENSMLEIVRAFSRHQRGLKLVMLGQYQPDRNAYHRAVVAAASDEVLFPGAIYDRSLVDALRLYGRLYIHGHQVGGTNPSLVEALGAGSAVLAHDNRFNRWVAGVGARFFVDEDSCAQQLDRLLPDNVELERLRAASRARFREAFTWDTILRQYEQLLLGWMD